ncbi:unnamed protein product [Kuraishia capsulata CBS 1993]|uniref:UspA domain-containing protein n=1 Tax=Kuraishia capsulata CBS 1993 TaxID=1382522 RepID=W6MPT1_9ASCO|nr:uncharacterized protein KUCA_T00004325001 [Kuraishia capsulata CBS 1993]CDK28343.1 unnamed protein product [Kuraishia capsulata CBS 1993]
MSLEAALDDERKQIIEIMERQKRKSEAQAKDASSRGRSQSPGMARTQSRGISGRSLSRGSVADDRFSITQHDPSERLRSPSSTRLKKDVLSDDEASLSSDEEQISDTDSEFGYDDGGALLPNFATYSPALETATTDKVNIKDEVASIGRADTARLIADAKKAEELDQLSAAERAVANARLVGQNVPRDVAEMVGADSRSPHNDKFFQEDKERKEKLKEYAVYKKKLVSPTGNANDNFLVPYTSDVEERKDSELARSLNEHVEVSPIESSGDNARAIRTITRGGFFEIVKGQKRPKTFLLCTDFSDESKYALEWCVGTVLVDGSVLYIINVIEDDDFSSMNLNGIPSQTYSKGSPLTPTASAPASAPSKSRDKLRTDNVERMTAEVLELLRLTKLQVHVVCESIHHPIPRHFIVEIIHHLSPTLVIVGSKGKSALKGVLLGSLSNYLVRKSNVPVMVVKRKLKKLTRRKANQFSNNIKPLHTLAEARID